jgi:regulator of replication initiation timing
MEYGNVVTLVRNGKELNALVAQSQPMTDGEHLTVIYLDPAFKSPILGGSALQQATATAFAVPFKEGTLNGWRECADSQDAAFVQGLMPHLIKLSQTVATADPHADISPDGTLQSAKKIIEEIKTLQMNAADNELRINGEWEKKVEDLKAQLNQFVQENLDLRQELAKWKSGELALPHTVPATDEYPAHVPGTREQVHAFQLDSASIYPPPAAPTDEVAHE